MTTSVRDYPSALRWFETPVTVRRIWRRIAGGLYMHRMPTADGDKPVLVVSTTNKEAVNEAHPSTVLVIHPNNTLTIYAKGATIGVIDSLIASRIRRALSLTFRRANFFVSRMTSGRYKLRLSSLVESEIISGLVVDMNTWVFPDPAKPLAARRDKQRYTEYAAKRKKWVMGVKSLAKFGYFDGLAAQRRNDRRKWNDSLNIAEIWRSSWLAIIGAAIQDNDRSDLTMRRVYYWVCMHDEPGTCDEFIKAFERRMKDASQRLMISAGVYSDAR
jgi:hypothetical protein